MTILEYLRSNQSCMERDLKKLTAHYFNWTKDRVFAEAFKLFIAITAHMDKESEVLNEQKSTQNKQLKAALKENERQRNEIEIEIDQLTQMHVYDGGYLSGLESLLRMMINHGKHCEASFYSHALPYQIKTSVTYNANLDDIDRAS